MDQKLFFPVPDVHIKDLLDWQNELERNQRQRILKLLKKQGDIHQEAALKLLHEKCFGKSLLLNDEKIALFRIGNSVYAIQSVCPHAGGPLHLADIEDIGSTQVCVKCPWHKWKFRLDNGETVFPPKSSTVAKTYPVKVENDGRIFVGFDAFGPSAFNLE
ncbi:Rieske domain-containing protein [Biomphalaria glabrata]|nr:Rieske domain-containing protein [Biomphalaria glabrata]